MQMRLARDNCTYTLNDGTVYSSVQDLTIFRKTVFKILAMGANDRQFGPELRTVFLSSANIMDFSALRF